MARPRPTRLRESNAPPPASARVIDAQFKVVKGKGRSRLAVIGQWLLAFAAAALIGFLVPPAWVLVQELGAMLGGR